MFIQEHVTINMQYGGGRTSKPILQARRGNQRHKPVLGCEARGMDEIQLDNCINCGDVGLLISIECNQEVIELLPILLLL